MNFQVISWKNNGNHINDKFVCNHNTMNKNISPELKWNSVKNAKSYSLIFQDSMAHTNDKLFVHWYIPYIDSNINHINELNYSNKNSKISLNNIILNKNNLKIISGKNSLNNIGYFPPCPPKLNNYDHIYTFYLYALDKKIDINPFSLECHTSYSFEKYLKESDINILAMEKISGKFHF